MALHEPWCCQRRVRSKNCASGQHRLWWQATGGPNQGCPELSVRNKWEFFRYQIFSIPIPILFFRTKFFRYQFRDFFRYQNFPLTIPIPPEKNEKFPVPVPIINLLNSKILATKISCGTKFFQYRFRDLFPVPNFSDTGSGTFFRYQIFPIPVPRLFSGTNFFPYRFRYNQKK